METYTFDASKEPLGRIATKAAILLRGKHNPGFRPNRPGSTRVIITNADKLVLTGKKMEAKRYYRHSGYIGHLKSRTASEMLQRDSRKIFIRAIWGMLPKNRLRKRIIKNLFIYKSQAKKEKLNS